MAIATKTVRLKGKRTWAGYSLPGEPGWNRPGGGDGDTASPRERSMNSVRLRNGDDELSRRRSQTRQRNQRKIFWYIQWSRDWRVRHVAASMSIQPEKARRIGIQLLDDPQNVDEEQTPQIWSWGEYRLARQALRRKGGVRKRVSGLVKWLATLNQEGGAPGEQLH